MTAENNKHKNTRHLILITGLLLLCRVLFILLMPATYSKDLYAWLDVIDLLRKGGNPYQELRVLNWPPVWMQTLFVIGKVAGATSISATRLIQFTLIAGEVLVATSVYNLCRKLFADKKITTAILIALAINPIGIFLSCQHCNFDVFVGLWVLWFVSALIDFHKTDLAERWLAACFFLGMGILTKTIPFVLAPLLISGIRKIQPKTILFGMALLIAPVVIGMSVIYTLAQQGVTEHVLSYRSMAGWYGVSGVFNILAVYDAIYAYSSFSPYIILALMTFASIRMSMFKQLTQQQVVIAVLTMLTFLTTFGPGYSPPYILWYLPLLPVYYLMAQRRTKLFMIVGFVVLVLTYITEYTFFDSHGAIIKTYQPDAETASLCDYLGQSKTQSIIRLPMFISYIIFFAILLRDINNPLTNKQQIAETK